MQIFPINGSYFDAIQHQSITDYQKARYIYLLNGLALKLAVGSLSEEDIMDIEQVMAIP